MKPTKEPREKRYQVIYADPPWSYSNQNPPCKVEKQPETCAVAYYYPTMKLEDIKGLPVADLCEKDSVLFLWATTPAIQEAFEVMKAWGFTYKTMITWEKTNNDCMGYWFRVCTEHLLVGVKGKVKSFRNMSRTCYHEKRGKHSAKPDYFRKLIESVHQGPYLEMFAREGSVDLFESGRPHWDVWGNEVQSDISLEVKP